MPYETPQSVQGCLSGIPRLVPVLAALALSGVPSQIRAASYELEGTIQQATFSMEGAVEMRLDGKFKVYVRDGAWFIETVEDKQFIRFAQNRQYLKREIGSTNGAEIFEIVTPLEPENQQTNAPLIPARDSQFNTAIYVSNAVPVGQLDGAVVGHLWLMFASGTYLQGVRTNLLTPVYNLSASAPGDPSLKYKARWELLDGPGSLPSNVVYNYDTRLLGDNNLTNAIYQVTGTTNLDGRSFPTGFLFENYTGGVGPRVRKRATAAVTAIRPECLLPTLMPAVTSDALVIDRRLGHAEVALKVVTYSVRSNSSLPTIAEVKTEAARKQGPPKRSSVLVAALLTTLLLPVAVGAFLVWRRRGRRARDA